MQNTGVISKITFTMLQYMKISKAQIDATDKEIDSMVYELYGLTKEEIEIVEKS